jgi:uncharacterized protein (DUF1697 family)
MALIVFLRGVNVGGHRTFRPSILAKKLSNFHVVNVGAAGTFIVRKPGARTEFRSALLQELPFEANVVMCEGRALARMVLEDPFADESSQPDIIRFVSVLPKTSHIRPDVPVAFPSDDKWLVRVIGSKGQFVFGMYRRHMKTIGCLGRLDSLFGTPVTTRNWSTVLAIVRILDQPV